MAKSEARRQKKLMRKKRKDKLRKQQRRRVEGQSSAKRIIYNARNYPIHECLISESQEETGLTQILLSRMQPNGNIVFGFYLVDRFCLGLKDTYHDANLSLSKYENELKASIYQGEPLIDCSVPKAHRIIYGAIEYASSLGFKPHKDFSLSKYILEEPDKIDDTIEIEFGKDGKPFFIAGPYDNADVIIRQLSAKLGVGNFDYLIPLEGEDGVMMEEDFDLLGED
jgi:hypothetical protein